MNAAGKVRKMLTHRRKGAERTERRVTGKSEGVKVLTRVKGVKSLQGDEERPQAVSSLVFGV